MRCVPIIVGAGALTITPGALGEDLPATAATGVEMQFIDPRLTPMEREVLTSAVGYAVPPLTDGAAWVGDTTLDLSALRGKVVVIQAYTHGDADGRAALRRTEDILKNIGADSVQLIALHTPEKAEESGAYFADKPPKIPTILDRTGAFCDELGVYTRPVTIVVDRSGKIRYAGVALARIAPAVELLAAESFDPSAPAPLPLPPRATRLNEGGGPGDGAAPAPSAPRPPFPPTKGQVGPARDVRGKQGPPLDELVFLRDPPQTEGRVVMLEFWATWCGPCIGNIPHLNELQKKFGDEITIIGASDEDEQKVRAFMSAKKMDYNVAIDKGAKIKRAISISGIPHAIIMSPDGIVRWQGHPATLDDKTIQQIIDASGTSGAGPAKPNRWVKAE